MWFIHQFSLAKWHLIRALFSCLSHASKCLEILLLEEPTSETRLQSSSPLQTATSSSRNDWFIFPLFGTEVQRTSTTKYVEKNFMIATVFKDYNKSKIVKTEFEGLLL